MKRPAFLERAVAYAKGRGLARLLSVYPPYVGAGVQVREVDSHTFDVSMRLRPWNQNYFGTHFGGSLYSMCDPFFALVLARELGPAYVVWDKAAAIRFLKPGKGTVRARFAVPRERVREIRERLEHHRKDEPRFTAQVLDQDGDVVAEVDKHLYVRKAR